MSLQLDLLVHYIEIEAVFTSISPLPGSKEVLNEYMSAPWLKLLTSYLVF